jgi:hypothetical protein
MRRITTAREQHEMLSPWREAARPGLRLPEVRGKTLDGFGFTQDHFRRNAYSWIDSLTPEELALGGLWYPVGHEWGEHIARRHGAFPLKVHAVNAATSTQRRWISKNLGRSSNLGDTYLLITSPLGSVTELGGKSAKSNLAKANRILAAPDDRDSVTAAFIGHDRDGRPKRIADSEKTHSFMTLLDDPETGGPGNYMAQPVVNDSWAGRAGIVSREQYERAKERASRTDRPIVDFIKYPGKGTGKGLDRFKPETAYDPETRQWYKTGEMLPPSFSEVAARVIGYGGGYTRMSNAVRAAAHRHGLDYAHQAQAGIWAAISGNKNPLVAPRPDVDLDSIEHPEELYNEMWARRASGLVAPRDPGGLTLPDHYGDDEDY